jgi:hypothetical protein
MSSLLPFLYRGFINENFSLSGKIPLESVVLQKYFKGELIMRIFVEIMSMWIFWFKAFNYIFCFFSCRFINHTWIWTVCSLCWKVYRTIVHTIILIFLIGQSFIVDNIDFRGGKCIKSLSNILFIAYTFISNFCALYVSKTYLSLCF